MDTLKPRNIVIFRGDKNSDHRWTRCVELNVDYDEPRRSCSSLRLLASFCDGRQDLGTHQSPNRIWGKGFKEGKGCFYSRKGDCHIFWNSQG
ncbi:hypothetical protein LAZ67_15000073 [Cordylochernes scorpioides]|uniref:Uncharacterized protein n=1 Tax=Cordylochernes scorpioides TaxID=51811 RepID=A0ABY6L8V3_9ARAC|nr:hypothetical protein LAZ67_15000073 [Cordylochernes scorpioides]